MPGWRVRPQSPGTGISSYKGSSPVDNSHARLCQEDRVGGGLMKRKGDMHPGTEEWYASPCSHVHFKVQVAWKRPIPTLEERTHGEQAEGMQVSC